MFLFKLITLISTEYEFYNDKSDSALLSPFIYNYYSYFIKIIYIYIMKYIIYDQLIIYYRISVAEPLLLLWNSYSGTDQGYKFYKNILLWTYRCKFNYSRY